MRALALVLLLPLFSGCLSEMNDEPWQVPQVLYPTALGSLSPEAPATQDVVLDWDCTAYQQMLEPPAWESEPMQGDVQIRKATLHVRYLALADATQCFPRNEWTAWFGTQDAFGTHPQVDGPPFLRTGEVHDVEIELNLPPGGLFVPDGMAIATRIAAYYSPAGSVALETVATRLELEAGEVLLEPTQERLLRDRSLSIGGVLCTSQTSQPGDPGTANVTFEVLPGDREIHVSIGASGLTADVDVVLLDPDGEYVWGGLGSMADEQVHLYGPNIRPGTWTALVFACTTTVATVPIAITVNERVQA